MFDVISSIFWTIIVFSILIVLHEGGHMLVARLFGVRVPEFMIGLPGPKISKTIKGTRYGVTAVPLGGYVKIAGMEPGPEDPLLAEGLAAITRAGELDSTSLAGALSSAEHRAVEVGEILVGWDVVSRRDVEDGPDVYFVEGGAREIDDPEALLDTARQGTYRALSAPKRIAVLSAGVIVNLVVAVIIFVGVLSIAGYDIPSTKVGTLASGGAAQVAGIAVGDRILSIDGVKVDEWVDVPDTVATLDVGQSVNVVVERDGATRTFEVVVGESEETGGKPMLGVSAGIEKYHPPVGESFTMAIDNVKLVGTAVAGLFSPEKFSNTVDQSSSIVGITVVTGQAAKAGPSMLTWLIASLSLSLGMMNLLPIPPLDGGKVVIEIVQGIFRRDLPQKLQIALSGIGMALLLTFFAYMLYADITKLAS